MAVQTLPPILGTLPWLLPWRTVLLALLLVDWPLLLLACFSAVPAQHLLAERQGILAMTQGQGYCRHYPYRSGIIFGNQHYSTRLQAECLGFQFHTLLTAILRLNVTVCMKNNSCVSDVTLR